MRRYQKLNRWKGKLSVTQLIVSFYFIAVLTSVILLSLPVFHQEGVEWTFTDAIFTSVSAISVTGLSVVSIKDTFNTGGILMLIFVLQFGGIGLMTLGTFVWMIARKRITFRQRMLIMTDQNQNSFAGLVKLMKQILIIIVSIELIGAFILGTYFLRYFPTWQEAFMQGFFASVSATTNAGFDITGNSLIPFANDYFVQIINMILLVLGAIGFPVLIEVKTFFKTENKNLYRFSLYTKVTSVTFFSLIVIGTVGIYLFERTRFFADISPGDTFFYSLFQSITTRNGGLATMDVADFSEPTLLLLCILMFIGASPSSVGGGIRTTTFAINVLSVWSFMRGKNEVSVFGREVCFEDAFKSFLVTFVASALCIFATILLSYTEEFTLMELFFEVCSAFGTTGLSMGITADLSLFGKWVIIILMFIGRIGILSFLFMFKRQQKKSKYRYPKEKIIIG